jgi:hypothetical protein
MQLRSACPGTVPQERFSFEHREMGAAILRSDVATVQRILDDPAVDPCVRDNYFLKLAIGLSENDVAAVFAKDPRICPAVGLRYLALVEPPFRPTTARMLAAALAWRRRARWLRASATIDSG